MKRSTLILGGLAAFAALWSAGWFAGRALYVEPEADLAVERLRAGSLFFAYERRAIGGFPFGYDLAFTGVTVRDAGGVWRWSAPEVGVSIGLAEGSALSIRPAAESRLTVESAAFGAGGAAPAVFDITADAPVVTLGAAEAGALVSVRAARLEAAQTPGAGAVSGGRLLLKGLDAEGVVAGAGGSGQLRAEAAEGGWRVSPDGVSESRASFAFAAPVIAFEGAALGGGSLSDFVARDGVFDFRLVSGAWTVSAASSGGPNAAPVDVTFSAAAGETLVAIRGGRAAYSSAATGARYVMAFDPPVPLASGAITLEGVEARLDMPLKPGPVAAPFALDLALRGAEPEAALWAAFDPAGALARGPMALSLSLEGAARVFGDLSAPSPAGAPVQVERLAIREFALAALGLEASASGALDLRGGAALPEGEIALDLRGAFGLLERAGAAGLLAPDAALGYRELLESYARPGEAGADHLLADIRVGGGRMEINGQRLR